MDKVNKFIRPLGFRRRTRSASSVGMSLIIIIYKLFHQYIQLKIILFLFLAYTDNKAHSDDSSSNSKDVVSSIYHVKTFFNLI